MNVDPRGRDAAFARSAATPMISDHESILHELRYDVDSSALPHGLVERFVRMELGEEGRTYLHRALEKRPGTARTALHRALRTFLSDFDANGLLGMYPMHLLGTSQWKMLIGPAKVKRLLDVGAGSGDVTGTLAPLAASTVTTESSRMMASRLRRRGFPCHEIDVSETGVPDPGYDLISCLNVVDRCARPRTLLHRLVEGLAPEGRLILATPFPFDAFFYEGPRSVEPEERLAVPRGDWEPSLIALVENELTPLGLEVETVTRVPYLCQGDSKRHMYVLDDAVIVCTKAASQVD